MHRIRTRPGGNGLRLSVSLDLDEITGQVLDLAVPRFAGAASVFVLEQLVSDGRPGGGDGVVLRRLGIRHGTGRPEVAEVTFPQGEVLACAPDTTYARCVIHGSPVISADVDWQTVERVAHRPGGPEALSRYRSFLAVPMASRSGTAGVLAFARSADWAGFGDDDAALVAGMAAQAGTCVEGACLLLRHQRTAEALQRGLLMGEPMMPAGIEVETRCVPAVGEYIGGDWWDVVALSEGRAGLIVGDAMGHGPEAAAVMAQLRAAAHALAELDLAPAELLRRLDRTAGMLRNAVFAPIATCVYAVIDPARESVTVAGAGHLSPIVILPDGTLRVPELPPGLPLGLGAAIFSQIRLRLPAGATLALFTDGLIETRSRTCDQGLLELRSVFGRERGALAQTCDSVLRALAGHGEDDATLVLARIPPGGSWDPAPTRL
jgi:Stage II sporulation protein E (SpoIIE)/GAF domain